ncbi:MAG: cytochrome c biogenesis protein CcsA [Gammaproteobacteria bacterium WSBS_2016_MAG_OTU1]
MILLHILTLFAIGSYLASRWRTVFFIPAAIAHLSTLITHAIQVPRFDFGMALSSFMLLTALIGWRQTRRSLSQPLLLILAACATGAPLLFVAAKPLPPLLALAHILPAALAYAFSLLAMLQWLDLWQAENARRRLQATATPPLLALEAACFKTLGWAFALLSLALISGLIGVLSSTGDSPTHKILFAAMSWLTFGGLLLGRHFKGWRGAAARWWLAAGLLFFILSYFGTHFVLQVILGRV